MNNNFNPKEVVNAVGAMAEMSWIFYNTCINQGFLPDQALCLTQTYLTDIILRPADPPQNDI